MQESQNERFAYCNEVDKAKRQRLINLLFMLGAVEAVFWLILAGFLFVEMGIFREYAKGS